MQRGVMVLLIALTMAATATVYGYRQDAQPPVTIFDSNPSHLWNRLYAALRVREDHHGTRIGEDSLDPPLWPASEYLLSDPSHQLAVQTLDDFLRTHGESLIHDPLKRALLQHDLWAVFDWTVSQFPASDRPNYEKEKQELQSRLAEVMRRLALTPDEIKALPDTYAQAVASGAFAKNYDSANRERAFLPPDLFDPHGTWAGITPSPEFGQLGVARDHTFEVSARSTFLVFMRLPGGHKATMDYFQTLWNFPQPYVPEVMPGDDQTTVNPDLPSFPAGTAVALIRLMNLFDTQGNLVATPIVESVQIRVYHDITKTRARFFSGSLAETIKNSGQDFYELRLSRPLLFSGRNGGLRALSRDEKELSTFRSKGGDEIEALAQHPEWEKRRTPILQTCIWCHSGGGVRSFNSVDALFRPNRKQVDPQNSDYGSVYWGDNSAAEWKQNRYDWGLLNGYWKAVPRP